MEKTSWLVVILAVAARVIREAGPLILAAIAGALVDQGLLGGAAAQTVLGVL